MCNCKSKPQYHRDDCLEFDAFGNKKTKMIDQLLNNAESLSFGIPFFDQTFPDRNSNGCYSFLLEKCLAPLNSHFILNLAKKNSSKKMVIFQNEDASIITSELLSTLIISNNITNVSIVPINQRMDYNHIIQIINTQSKMHDILVFSDLVYFKNKTSAKLIQGFHRDPGFLNNIHSNYKNKNIIFLIEHKNPLINGNYIPSSISNLSELILSIKFYNSDIYVSIQKTRNITNPFPIKSFKCQFNP